MTEKSLGDLLDEALKLLPAAKVTKNFDDLNDRIVQILKYHLKR